MHAVRVVAAMIVGGYASIPVATFVAEAYVPRLGPADGGLVAIGAAPLIVGGAAAILAVLLPRRAEQ